MIFSVRDRLGRTPPIVDPSLPRGPHCGNRLKGGDMNYHLFSASLLGTALILETLGFAGSVVLLGAGVGCEVWYWMRMVRGRRRSLARGA